MLASLNELESFKNIINKQTNFILKRYRQKGNVGHLCYRAYEVASPSTFRYGTIKAISKPCSVALCWF